MDLWKFEDSDPRLVVARKVSQAVEMGQEKELNG